MGFFNSLCVLLLLLIHEYTTSSIDPCYNYNTIDNKWRDIRPYPLYKDHDDTLVEWSGWYRLYLNGQSAQMSEWCVTSTSCGGYTGLYLNASHPTLADGVVTRDVLGFYYQFLQCGKYRSTPIQVKACPGEYYVYKLTKPNITIPRPSYCAVVFQNISSDPCYNYESLDRPWRANNESGDSIYEFYFSWRGWYRLFYYGMDIRMPDTCTKGHRCNTFVSLYLDGPHPQIEDGVVIREVCASPYEYSCCDYKSIPIRVKACPGNYYVYELVNTEYLCSGYCTDVSTISRVVSTASPDVFTGSIITFNFDPCNSYNILNNYWRNTHSYPFVYDVNGDNHAWDGWYRLLLNGLSAQMPDWCASYMTCGGFSSLWLHGSHPRLEDGVVTREVYGSYNDQCNRYRSNPIQVKACAGDYYVYKFTRPSLSIPAPRYCAVESYTSTSVDPCYNYTSLNEPWRTTNNSYSSYNYNCDYSKEWKGWYRLFFNNQSAQIPESCVNKDMCGTLDPLWLNGSHPKLEDGVVRRDICVSSWMGCCGLSSQPIRVKACPGLYYVYELVKPIVCSAYCIEASNFSSTAVTTTTQRISSTAFITTPTTTTEITTSSFDPCYDYNITDDYWRNIQQSPYQYYYDNDDTLVEWSGWYRLYLNGQSAQMSEWCINYMRCGGESGLYLNGSHPTLEDGVVTRDVLGYLRWYDQCGSYRSTSIKVKACPGDYYVYELVKPDVSIPRPSYCAVAFPNISSDPCYNYASMDRPWRANNATGEYFCDESLIWSGWYRLFYYGMNIRMSETCASSYSCNTGVNLALKGPHPQIEDGVVIREVCGHSNWISDAKSVPIRVKACAGNYYVYELVNPQIWCAGYCTDISTITQVALTVSPQTITGSSITMNYDPCSNYSILDNYWRSTSSYWYIYGYVNGHDDTLVEWDGWYRLFINESSSQMPEWCVPYMSCGGFTSLWLHGSHPQLEDGVVTREVFGSRYDDCNRYRSNPIQVKACPGDYYVYKFIRPTVSIPAPVYCAVPFNTPSVDPCYNYTSLDEPWRSTDYYYYNNYYNHFMCDYVVAWDGWYRLFNNNQSAQMPDSCVNEGMCGTYYPLSLNGSHPELEDGVVLRHVCVSDWTGCCTYISHPIRVKACPGDYYVYEFVKPVTCGAYCLVNQSSTSVSRTTQSISLIESITPPITTTAPPVDPCYNYNVLDEPWRATSDQNSSQLMCDSAVSWSGWYRLFINGQSVQMPDTCVDENSCGTNAPLWLSGGHPTLEDGVVSRDVCGHWNNDCCYFQSNPIQVKACPGGFYVYEFVRPSGCNLAYCADVRFNTSYTTDTPETTTTETATIISDVRNPCSELNCSKEERCGMKNGVYGCLCNKGHQKHRAPKDSFDFNETCESSSGSMSVSRCQLFEAGFSAEHLHLNDPSCRGTVQNGRVEFNFDNDQHICGTNLVANGSHFIYSNYIVGTPGTEGLISRVRILKLSFSCVYPQTQTLSMNVEINPLQSTVHKVLPSGEGVYQVRMVPYVDEEFTQPFTGRVDAELDQEMHVEVGVEGVDSRQFALVIDDCWATPENDPTYSLRWDLIIEECPNPEEDAVKLLQNGVSTSSRFSFRMFIFTANSTKLYLHCAVHLCLLSSEQCSTSCDSGEQRRERRALDLHDSASLSMGPLVWSGENTDVQFLPDQVKVSEASCLCASLVLLFIPLMSFFTLS